MVTSPDHACRIRASNANAPASLLVANIVLLEGQKGGASL